MDGMTQRRRCAHCASDIKISHKRKGARFCSDAHRIAYHRNRSLAQGELERLNLNRFEAALLIDSGVPWHPAKHVERWPRPWWHAEQQTAAERARQEREWVTAIRKAAYRLAARGLVRIGRQRQDRAMEKNRRIIIERTEIGSQLLAKRHNELHAIAERVGEAVACKPEDIAWRNGPSYEEDVAARAAQYEQWERERLEKYEAERAQEAQEEAREVT
jgi:DNA-binding MarR family transcriptional regulator